MTKSQSQNSYELAFQEYYNRLREIYSQGDFTEMSYRTFLHNFVENVTGSSIPNCRLTEESKKDEGVFGRPDFKARRGAVTVGYIETKEISANLNEIMETEQLKKYVTGIDNLILTNYCEFILIRKGSVAMVSQLISNDDLKNNTPIRAGKGLYEFIQLIMEFFKYKFSVIKSAQSLAIELAKKSRILKDLAITQLKIDLRASKFNEPTSSIFEFMEIMQDLIRDIKVDDCADAYAQTIAYGLFLGRYYQSQELEFDPTQPITRTFAHAYIPKSVGLIKKILLNVGADLPTDLSWIVEEICEVLSSTDIGEALSDVSQRTGHKAEKERDAFLLFYEDFLAEYDPDKRKSRGIYYTPRQVVSYIVKSVDQIIRSEFALSGGFANKDVTVLDPATGTGTFLNIAYLRAIDELNSKEQYGKIKGMIHSHLIKNFYGFELLIPPYILSHLKLSRQLIQWGGKLEDTDRVQVYLSNTLEGFSTKDTYKLEAFNREIGKESGVAREIKKKPILIILGNPPYSATSVNNGDWIQSLLKEGYTRADGTNDDGYYKVDGVPLGERNPKWLQDDYVKFIRFGQWKIDTAGKGVLAYVTNHSFLDNPTFRGMRKSLMNSFDTMYFLNLHGNALKKEVSPDGSKDENVFDIMQGVSISIFIKNGINNRKGIFYGELYGNRDSKFYWLDRHTIWSTSLSELTPLPPFYFFVPKNFSSDYNEYWKITDIFPEYSPAIVTARDNLTIKWSETEVWKTVSALVEMETESARSEFNLGKDSQEWNLSSAQSDLKESGPTRNNILQILYRPFDTRYTYYTGKSNGFIGRPRSKVMQSLNPKYGNLGIITRRQMLPPYNYVFVTNTIISDGIIRSDNKGVESVFPLYIFEEEGARHANVSKIFLDQLEKNYGTTPTPEDILAYCYAILQAPKYLSKFGEQFESDFPRIPIVRERSEFNNLVAKGKELVNLHLNFDKQETEVKYMVSGSDAVENISFNDGKVFINSEQFFEGVSREEWEYSIGSYKILEKWLKSRKKRVLRSEEIGLFMCIAQVIKRTIEIRNEIDGILTI